MSDFAEFLTRLLNRQLTMFKPRANTLSSTPSPLLTDLTLAFGSISNPSPGVSPDVSKSDRVISPRRDAKDQHKDPRDLKDSKDVDSKSKKDKSFLGIFLMLSLSVFKLQIPLNAFVFSCWDRLLGKMKGLTRGKTVNSGEFSSKDGSKDKSASSLKGTKNRSAVAISGLKDDKDVSGYGLTRL